jgi:hypothetical protein
MHFHEEPIDSDARCSASQWFDEFTLTAGLGSPAARQLDAMSGVKDHGVTKASQDREGPHIDDKVVVAERRSPLRQDNLLIP